MFGWCHALSTCVGPEFAPAHETPVFTDKFNRMLMYLNPCIFICSTVHVRQLQLGAYKWTSNPKLPAGICMQPYDIYIATLNRRDGRSCQHDLQIKSNYPITVWRHPIYKYICIYTRLNTYTIYIYIISKYMYIHLYEYIMHIYVHVRTYMNMHT